MPESPAWRDAKFSAENLNDVRRLRKGLGITPDSALSPRLPQTQPPDRNIKWCAVALTGSSPDFIKKLS